MSLEKQPDISCNPPHHVILSGPVLNLCLELLDDMTDEAKTIKQLLEQSRAG